MVPQGINALVGSESGYVAAGGAEAATSVASDIDSDNVVTDGTEFVVAALVIGALLVLILFRVGGFQAVIATR